MLSALYFLVAVTMANGRNTATNFTSNRKILQCHEIKPFNVRSAIECALQCVRDLYSCAGYVLERAENKNICCEVCLIYDVTTQLVNVNLQNNRTSGLPEISKETGEMVYEFKASIISTH